MAFYTIVISPGLSEVDFRRVLALGDPPEVVSRAEQPALLRSAGFVGIEETDVTEEFLRTARGWLEARERYASEVGQLEGASEFAQGQANRRAKLEAIRAGLLRRALFVALRSR